MFQDFITLTFKSLRHRPLRSWLTVVGIVLAVALVVAIFALGSGVQGLLSKTLQMFGSDLVIVYPGKETNPFTSIVGGQRFRESDITALEMLPGVAFVAPADVSSMNVEYNGEKQTAMVHGIPWKPLQTIFEESQGARMQDGAWPSLDDSNDVVLGSLAASKLFKTPVKVGDDIILRSKHMRVAGILSSMGNQEDDNSFFLSLTMFHAISGKGPGAFSAFVKAVPGTDLAVLSQEIKFELSKQDVVHDFSVITPSRANEIVGNILGIVEFALLVIALMSLVVGAIGIMNTMYTSVLERTKHIGIMKAVGATDDAILSLFLIESGMIGLVGGVLGIVLGIAAAWGVGILAAGLGVGGLFSFATLDFSAFLVVLVVTFITGTIAGFLPARAASRMQPAEALRYE